MPKPGCNLENFATTIQGIGDDDSVVSSSNELQHTNEGFTPVFFEPRDLTNLGLIDEMESLCPLMDMKVWRKTP